MTNKFSGWKLFRVVLMLSMTITAVAQTFRSVASFDTATGVDPGNMSLVQSIDASLYGTASLGGNTNCNEPAGCGTVFKVEQTGNVLAVHRFCSQPDCSDGGSPSVGLIQAVDGNLYGTVPQTEANHGTVFSIHPRGGMTTIYTFCAQPGCTDGSSPEAALVQGADGSLYGTTINGGGGGCPQPGCGTVFKLSLSGTFTTLYSFCSQANCVDGAGPYAGLVQGNDGNFYGTTKLGGDPNCPYNSAGGCGTAFRITPAGVITTLHIFEITDGKGPSQLVQGSDGNFYGTTSLGGANSQGTIFKMGSDGTLTVLYNFLCTRTSCSAGHGPNGSGLIQATDGNFYGASTYGGYSCGGDQGCGTVFKITSTGALTVVHEFCAHIPCADGSNPTGGLVQATDGNLYGTTSAGGANNGGTLYALLTKLGPFVAFVNHEGSVGQSVIILGQGFDGTTAVSFNGTPAVFTVNSPSELTATVPAGATTGPATVTTPDGTRTSNVPFVVLP